MLELARVCTLSFCSERLTFEDFEVLNFHLFSSQNSDLDNEQLDEIKQKAQAKNQESKRAGI